MKIRLSTYSLHGAIIRKEMSIVDVIHWIAKQGGEHVENVPIGYDLIDNPQLAEEIRQTAEDAKIDISNYAVGANFAVANAEARIAMDNVRRLWNEV